MRILGMPLWRENLSDEQYVERVRKGLRLSRRLRYIKALVGVGILAFVVWLGLLSLNLLTNLSNLAPSTGHGAPSTQEQVIYEVYFGAAAMGFFAGLMFANAVIHIASALFDYRKDKLLVECWDGLSDAEKARLRLSHS
jgi:hypothetical protein